MCIYSFNLNLYQEIGMKKHGLFVSLSIFTILLVCIAGFSYDLEVFFPLKQFPDALT